MASTKGSPRSFDSSFLLAQQLFKPRLKVRDVFLFDVQRRDDLFAAGEGFFIAVEMVGHPRDGLLAELERLLDHGALNDSLGDAVESISLFCETDDLHLAGFAPVLDRVGH